MRLATWNINSVRLRLPLLKQFVEEASPDVICLQETKCQDEHFPLKDIQKLGFEHVAFSGEKSYNGVAILSKLPMVEKERRIFGKHDHKRHICVEFSTGVTLHNVYVPAGGDEPDPKINPKFAHKLEYMEDLATFFGKHSKKDKIILVGDMNIAPLEHDVWSHKQLLKIVSHTPPETERMEKLRKTLSWIDTARHFVPEDEKLYSWWSYRNRDWKKSNRGRRLDHIWITPALGENLKASETLYHIRDWEKPSDHVPVVTDFIF